MLHTMTGIILKILHPTVPLHTMTGIFLKIWPPTACHLKPCFIPVRACKLVCTTGTRFWILLWPAPHSAQQVDEPNHHPAMHGKPDKKSAPTYGAQVIKPLNLWWRKASRGPRKNSSTAPDMNTTNACTWNRSGKRDWSAAAPSGPLPFARSRLHSSTLCRP